MVSKPPAFQWYPKDYLSDVHTVLMTLQQEGAYMRLINYCWLEGSLPNDMEALGRMCKGLSAQEMSEVWKAIEPCFKKRGNRWVHPRLLLERKKQMEYSAAKSRAGRKGAEARYGKQKNSSANGLPVAKINSSSSTSSATSSAKKKTSKKRPEYSSEFEGVWKCHPKGPKKEAFYEFKKAVKSGVIGHSEMQKALRIYVSSFTGNFTGVHLFRWIRDERWDEAQTDSGMHTSNVIIGGKERVR